MKTHKFAIAFIGTSLTLGFGLFYSGQRTTPAYAEMAKARIPILFSSLDSATETAVLDYKMERCFYSPHYRFEYASYPSPHVTVIAVEGRNGHKAGEVIGVVTLTRAQVIRFDNLLHALRTNHSQVDSIEKVTFAVFRRNQKTHSEYFVNCSGADYNLADAYSEDIPFVRSYTYPDKKQDTLLPVLSLFAVISFAEKYQRMHHPLPYVDTPRIKTRAYGFRIMERYDRQKKLSASHQ